MRNIILTIILLSSFGCSNRSFYKDLNDFDISPSLPRIQFQKVDNQRSNGILRYVCKQDNLYSHGTAFVIKHQEKNYIVTAYHTYETGGENLFYLPDRTPIKIHIENIIIFPTYDILLFEVIFIETEIEPIGVSNHLPGNSTIAVGFPKDGELSSYIGKVRKVVLETDVFVEVGMSGGPIIEDGKVVGIISEKVIGGDIKSRNVDIMSVLRLLDKKR